jgi:hypothetical protein
MILAPLTAFTLALTVAIGPEGTVPMSAQQKSAALQPLVRSATKCIANSVADNPQFAAASHDLGDLIVDSMPSCMNSVRAMIDAYDRYYGTGSGEAFFMGPYLAILPRAVGELIAKPSH